MIELIFVIVILGILAAVGLPKLAGMKDEAYRATGHGEVMSIRVGIQNQRQRNLILGNAGYISTTAMDAGTGLFGGVLGKALQDNSNKSGSWHILAAVDANTSKYEYKVGDVKATFYYYADGPDKTMHGTVFTRGDFNCGKDEGNADQEELCKDLNERQ